MPEDPSQFNIRTIEGKVLCPTCGLPGAFDAYCYDERGGLVGTGICPCCLWEPGFDDHPGASSKAQTTIIASIREYRRGWLLSGASWQGKLSAKPGGWDGKRQLEHLLAIAPHLA